MARRKLEWESHAVAYRCRLEICCGDCYPALSLKREDGDYIIFDLGTLDRAKVARAIGRALISLAHRIECGQEILRPDPPATRHGKLLEQKAANQLAEEGSG